MIWATSSSGSPSTSASKSTVRNSPQRALEVRVSLQHARVLGRGFVEHRGVPVGHAVLRQGKLTLPQAVERQKSVPQNLKQPGPEVSSRLEPMGESERAQVGFLHQILGLGRAPCQIDRKVVERI